MKNQENQKLTEDEYDFSLKGKDTKKKMVLVTMKIEKTKKYEDVEQCTQEALCRILKLTEKWTEEGSIAGIIDTDGMVRREDFVEINK